MPAPTVPPIPDRTDGEVIDETWFDILKEVAEDHEGRLEEVEFVKKTIEFTLNGRLSLLVATSEYMVFRVPDALDILKVSVFVQRAGSAGNFSAAVQVSSDGGSSWNSLCSVEPTAAFGSGNFFKADGTINPTYDQVVAGNLLRLNLISAQTDQIGGQVLIEYQETALPTPP